MEKSNKNSIFAALESATLPIEQRTRAELFVYMRMEYINPPLGSVLCCLLYWLNAIDPRNELCAKFKDLLSQYPEVDTNAMGFPKHWQDEPLWR